MKVIIAGSRGCNDYEHVTQAIARSGFYVTEVVSGVCRGPDLLGEDWAQERGIPVKRFPADWKKYGKAAGPIRNEKMVQYADALVAVWDGKSSGTAHIIALARGRRMAVYIEEITNLRSSARRRSS